MVNPNTKIKLTDEEIHSVRLYIINQKLQQQAIVYAGIPYSKFKNAMDSAIVLSRQQYIRLMEFCEIEKQKKEDS